MKNIYEQCPTYETESFLLRLVKIEDAEAKKKISQAAAEERKAQAGA